MFYFIGLVSLRNNLGSQRDQVIGGSCLFYPVSIYRSVYPRVGLHDTGAVKTSTNHKYLQFSNFPTVAAPLLVPRLHSTRITVYYICIATRS